MQRESKASILFRHYIKKNKMYTCALEMKQSTTDSILFSCVEQAQIDWGMAIKSKEGVMLRVVAVAEGMPDYIYLREEPAYVVIKFPDMMCVIDIETFAIERDRSKRKSLTQTRASEISIITVKCASVAPLPHQSPSK